MIAQFDSSQSNKVAFASKDDPYDSTILIRGGTFAMGMNQENIMGDWNNNLRRVTVSSFRIDQYEVSNRQYRTYIKWLESVFIPLGKDSIVKAALPDTLVWRTDLAYNEPMVEGYFRNKAFNDYPVVGISWEQANAYCRWRTDRANEKTLIKYGLIDPKKPYIGKLENNNSLVDSNKKSTAISANVGAFVQRVCTCGLLLFLRSLLIIQALVSDAAHQGIFVNLPFVLLEFPIHNGNAGTLILHNLNERKIHDDGDSKHVLHG